MTTPDDHLPSDLAALFQALSAEEASVSDDRRGAPAADPLEVVRRIEAEEGVDEPQVRAALAEVMDALGHRSQEAPLAPRVRQAVVAAYTVRPGAMPRVGDGPPPLPASRERPASAEPAAPLRARRIDPVLRIAAALLVALGVGLFLASRREAGASLRVAGMDRLALDGSRREVGSSRTLVQGTALGGQHGELLVLTLTSGGRLVLGPGDEAAIVGVPRASGAHEGRLALVRGRARLDATRGGVELDLGAGRTFELLQGRAALHRTPEGVVVIPDASAVLRLGGKPRGGSDGAPFLVTPRGEIAPFVGEVASDVFQPLDRIDVPHRAAQGAWRVAPRRWRVRTGSFERRGRSVTLSPSASAVTLAWMPFASLAAADTLDLELRGGPALVRARLEGAEVVPVDPSAGTTQLALPPSWFEGLAGGELEVEFTWPDASMPPQPVHLDGAVFLRAGSARVPASSAAVPPAPTGESDEVR